MEILYLILVLLAVTRVFAELAERVQLPAIVGELIAGVALGFVLQRFSGHFPSLASDLQGEAFWSLTDLGMFFLMLLAGIRMEPLDFARTSRSAVFVALGGMALPVAAGFALGLLVLPESSLKLTQSLFLGVALAITAVPVTVRIFMDLGELESRIGRTVVAAALWDDLLSLLLLALLLGAMGASGGAFLGSAPMLALIGKVFLFFAITIPLGLYVLPRLSRYFRHLRFPEVDFSMLLIGALAYAVLAEILELHFILGAFLAGMFFHPKAVDPEAYERVEQQMSGITRGFMAPIFFVSIGLHLDLEVVARMPGFLLVLTATALLSKLLGAGLPAYWAGLGAREAAMVGVGMSGRGAVELIVAQVASQAGLFRHPDPPPLVLSGLFSAIVFMALATTLLAPILLRWLHKR
jgi:Kef-type K+ transport system membrane component KefB